MIGPKDEERIHCVEGRFIFLVHIVETPSGIGLQ